jgi:hypothetical protein
LRARAVDIVSVLDADVASAGEAREILGLSPR